eukprot:TRINITY_DN3853_c0_g1_i1.p1 TRINITY_DN3853_c0_g1~~TRINITY_DN3853_c0_g1_i1.p1  ORF type:complete len:179 (-),score=19.68 TRINITY_DN3853_c0_g1_i1:289-825(-)
MSGSGLFDVPSTLHVGDALSDFRVDATELLQRWGSIIYGVLFCMLVVGSVYKNKQRHTEARNTLIQACKRCSINDPGSINDLKTAIRRARDEIFDDMELLANATLLHLLKSDIVKEFQEFKLPKGVWPQDTDTTHLKIAGLSWSLKMKILEKRTNEGFMKDFFHQDADCIAKKSNKPG